MDGFAWRCDHFFKTAVTQSGQIFHRRKQPVNIAVGGFDGSGGPKSRSQKYGVKGMPLFLGIPGILYLVSAGLRRQERGKVSA